MNAKLVDGCCLGDLKILIEWVKILMLEGLEHGYYNEISKMVLIVAPQYVEQATETFHDFGIKVLTGHRLLGGFVGSDTEWIQKKVDFWVKCVNNITQIANKDPHSAFVAVSKSLRNEWSFVQRVVNVDENSYLSLKQAICQNLLP